MDMKNVWRRKRFTVPTEVLVDFATLCKKHNVSETVVINSLLGALLAGDINLPYYSDENKKRAKLVLEPGDTFNEMLCCPLFRKTGNPPFNKKARGYNPNIHY